MFMLLINIFSFSNVDRLRDFIKHVYEDRRYTGERGSDRPPRVKMVSYVIVPSLSQDKQLKLTDCFLTGMLMVKIVWSAFVLKVPLQYHTG